MSDKELNDGMTEVERLRDRLRELMDRFETMKLAALRGVLTPRAAFLNNTAAVLRALYPTSRRDVLNSVDRGVDVSGAPRQIRKKAPAGRAPDDAEGGGDPWRKSREAVNT
jgi:hypothetical protein